MKYNICLIDSDSLYIEKFVELISKKYSGEVFFATYKDETEYRMSDNQIEFDAVYVGERDNRGEEYFYMMGYENEKVQKYQKPYDMWNQMKQLCEKRKIGKITINEARISRNGVVSYSLQNDMVIDMISYQMIRNNDIFGLLKITEINEREIKYDIKGKISLAELLDNGLNNTVILNIMNQIIEITNDLDDYMLNVEQLILEKQYIFIEKDTMQVKLCYCPVTMDTSHHNDAEESEIGKTTVFESLQEIARESMERKIARAAGIFLPGEPVGIPYLIRKKNNERIDINRDIFKIGKEREYVDYVIDDNHSISRSHADIVRRNDGFYIVDQNSLNHTYVNGILLQPKKYMKLEKNDLIVLADEVFEFFI